MRRFRWTPLVTTVTRKGVGGAPYHGSRFHPTALPRRGLALRAQENCRPHVAPEGRGPVVPSVGGPQGCRPSGTRARRRYGPAIRHSQFPTYTKRKPKSERSTAPSQERRRQRPLRPWTYSALDTVMPGPEKGDILSACRGEAGPFSELLSSPQPGRVFFLPISPSCVVGRVSGG